MVYNYYERKNKRNPFQETYSQIKDSIEKLCNYLGGIVSYVSLSDIDKNASNKKTENNNDFFKSVFFTLIIYGCELLFLSGFFQELYESSERGTFQYNILHVLSIGIPTSCVFLYILFSFFYYGSGENFNKKFRIWINVISVVSCLLCLISSTYCYVLKINVLKIENRRIMSFINFFSLFNCISWFIFKWIKEWCFIWWYKHQLFIVLKVEIFCAFQMKKIEINKRNNKIKIDYQQTKEINRIQYLFLFLYEKILFVICAFSIGFNEARDNNDNNDQVSVKRIVEINNQTNKEFEKIKKVINKINQVWI